MPLSFGIPLGFIIALVGIGIFFTTRNKTLGKIILGIGAALALLTVGAIFLVMNSPM